MAGCANLSLQARAWQCDAIHSPVVLVPVQLVVPGYERGHVMPGMECKDLSMQCISSSPLCSTHSSEIMTLFFILLAPNLYCPLLHLLIFLHGYWALHIQLLPSLQTMPALLLALFCLPSSVRPSPCSSLLNNLEDALSSSLFSHL